MSFRAVKTVEEVSVAEADANKKGRVPLVDGWRLDVDSANWILQRRQTPDMKKRDADDDEPPGWANFGYYPSLIYAMRAFTDARVRERITKGNSLPEAISRSVEEIRKFMHEIEKVLTVTI